MNFCFQALVRCFLCILVALVFVPGLLAQQYNGFGTATKPHTVVYKLKTPSYSGSLRVAGNDNTLEKAVESLGTAKPRQKFPAAKASANTRMASPSGISLIYELQHSPAIPFEQVKRALLATGQVAYVEPLYLREPLHQPNEKLADSTSTDQFNQYYLKLIRAYDAWDVEKGDTTVVIGILDTGFLLTHTELKDKVVINKADPIDGIDNDKDGFTDNYSGWDFAENDNDVSDNTTYRGHGTGVAGVAAAKTNNGIGMAGVGYNLKFLPLKIFPGPNKFNFGGYEAIVYAADKGCKVINLSWGGEGFSQYEQDIINYAVLEKDVVVIASAGNTNAKIDMYPASYNHVISVSGTTQQDLKVPTHTYSYKVDMTAPSRDIYTTHATHNNGYNYTSGTSYGAPMVSATAALVRSKHPELNALQVMERVRVTADNIYQQAGNAPFSELLGKGRLNMKRALKETNVKSVRCISFNTDKGQPLQSGNTTAIVASFTNYLNPLQNLQVTLSSPSPYVTITQETSNFGSMATSATANNTERPFQVTVSADAPANALVPLRIGYTDGTYTDFQYFELIINPDYLTLNSENIKLTFNGKGNIGYNGLNMGQGIGLTYKESGSLLFEGGLIVATGPERVSDNLHNGNWANDGNFISTSPARLRFNTKLADQDLKGAMKDRYPNKGNAGVEVKYKAYSWSGSNGSQDFIVVEYQIKNITSETIPSLHAGLFADWDIGKYTENAADWDAANLLGYAYNKTASLPYTGIKLLTKDTASYYAIENATLNVEDGFTDAEKYKTLSSGVTQAQAGKNGKGANIAQVVGAVAKDLAPGAVKTVAFAILAGSNLQALQTQGEAAQLKYISIKSGAAPLAFQDTVCVGGSATWTPQGGNNFRFYADVAKKELLGTGSSYTVENFSQPRIVYAASIDSLFEGEVGAANYALPRQPEVEFTFTDGPVYPGSPVAFQNKSSYGKNFVWHITDSNNKKFAGENLTYAFTAPGTYEATLTAEDNYGCITNSVTKTIKVLYSSPEVLQEALSFYPNPAQKTISIKWLPGSKMSQYPEVVLVDVLGKQFKPKVTIWNSVEASLSLDGLAAGVYHAQVIYENTRLIRRIVVL